jgi:hypothetical protein
MVTMMMMKASLITTKIYLAALYGILAKIRDMGLLVVSVCAA